MLTQELVTKRKRKTINNKPSRIFKLVEESEAIINYWTTRIRIKKQEENEEEEE